MKNKALIINLILVITSTIITIILLKLAINDLSDPTNINSTMYILSSVSMFITFVLLIALILNTFYFFYKRIDEDKNNASKK